MTEAMPCPFPVHRATLEKWKAENPRFTEWLVEMKRIRVIEDEKNVNKN